MLYKSELTDVNGFDFQLEMKTQERDGKNYAVVRMTRANSDAEVWTVDFKTLRRLGREMIHFGELAEKEAA